MRQILWTAVVVAGMFAGVGRAEVDAGTAPEDELVTLERSELQTLQRELARLQREVVELRAQLQERAPGTEPSEVVASASFTGRVMDVRAGWVTLIDLDGETYQLKVDERTRALESDGERIAVRSLDEGAVVRASLDLVGDQTFARDIVVLGDKEVSQLRRTKNLPPQTPAVPVEAKLPPSPPAEAPQPAEPEGR
ncbi:MAG: hypothetical protein ACOZIN_22175 [Myxococcota bacterium]